ncbi:MAG: ABC transporter permease [Candidatus Methanomethylophilaceae archaeon]|nr:ABC transporter permease [Candidatus Methanomethylophilaceae archaeon]
MYNLFGETARVAYGDLCYLKKNFPYVLVSSVVGPLLYLVAFGLGMRSGSTESGVDYIAYIVPGVIAISSMNAGFSSSSQKILLQRLFHSSFDELVLCPMHTSAIVLGKSLFGIVRGMLGGTIMLVLGMFMTQDLTVTPWLFVVMLFSCTTFSMLGVMAGLLAKNSTTLMMISSVVILPMTFMCGTLFSVSALPEPLAAVVWALPLTHSTEMLRGLALDTAFPWVSLAVLAVYLVAFYVIDHYVIVKKLYRRCGTVSGLDIDRILSDADTTGPSCLKLFLACMFGI